MQNKKIFSLILMAIGAAIIAVLSPLAIPLGVVPITLQTLAVGLIAVVLRPRESFGAVLLYLILGLIGLPVFTGGAAGFGVLWGPMGGFLLAFLLVGPLISFLLSKLHYRAVTSFLVNIICHLLILLIGSIWLKFFMNIAWSAAFKLAFTPFVLVEIIKALLAVFIGLALLRALAPTNKYFTN